MKRFISLLLSASLLDLALYNDSPDTDINWGASSLRSFLNEEFYNNAFSDSEKAAISVSSVVNEKNPVYDSNGGDNPASDRVFCLSLSEALLSAVWRRAAETEYRRRKLIIHTINEDSYRFVRFLLPEAKGISHTMEREIL